MLVRRGHHDVPPVLVELLDLVHVLEEALLAPSLQKLHHQHLGKGVGLHSGDLEFEETRYTIDIMPQKSVLFFLSTCMCSTILSMSGLGPVANPTRIPELRILEKESKRSTRPSVSMERKLEGK